ncbi:hypothetical protein N643_05730 [Salmonella bongori serovar 48:z41:-- str. RKS3044]|nr:hypothetical protein N643_05730 [Salmonella bongori serovar 48:z41:-- str. RKS3044]
MRIYPGIFKRVKKTVNRSSKFIFSFFQIVYVVAQTQA